MRLMAVILLIVLSGCAERYPNEVRINRYGTSGQYIPFAEAQVDGIAVYKKGNIKDITVTYKDGDKINVKVGGGKEGE